MTPSLRLSSGQAKSPPYRLETGCTASMQKVNRTVKAGLAMQAMMLFRTPLELVLDEGFWDELLDGGFREIAIWWMTFLQEAESGDVTLPSPEDVRPRVLDYFESRSDRYDAIPVVGGDETLYDGIGIKPPRRPRQGSRTRPLGWDVPSIWPETRASSCTRPRL